MTTTTNATAALRGRTVLDAAVRRPKVSTAAATVAEVRGLFRDDHVHAALVVADDRRLLSVIERRDLDPALNETGQARHVGMLEGRVIHPHADLEHTWQAMRSQGRRRLALVDDEGVLLGLLCLKRTGLGFCADDDVCARQHPDQARRTFPSRPWADSMA